MYGTIVHLKYNKAFWLFTMAEKKVNLFPSIIIICMAYSVYCIHMNIYVILCIIHCTPSAFSLACTYMYMYMYIC